MVHPKNYARFHIFLCFCFGVGQFYAYNYVFEFWVTSLIYGLGLRRNPIEDGKQIIRIHLLIYYYHNVNKQSKTTPWAYVRATLYLLHHWLPGARNYIHSFIWDVITHSCPKVNSTLLKSLSSLCKLIWRHWTYEMPVRYILSNVWVRFSIFSTLSRI